MNEMAFVVRPVNTLQLPYNERATPLTSGTCTCPPAESNTFSICWNATLRKSTEFIYWEN